MEKIRNENLIVRNIIVGLSFLLAFLWVINPEIRSAIGINLVFLAISFFVYNAREYQDDLIGINKSNITPSIGYGILLTFMFYLLTLFVPGMSIGYPTLPESISDSLRSFFVNFVAPITESIFFLGSLYAWVHNFGKDSQTNRWTAIFIQAFVFAMFHIGAYLAGFYSLPSFAEGISAISANLSAFFVAFLFGIVSGWFVTRDGIKNLLVGIVFHAGANIITFYLAIAVF